MSILELLVLLLIAGVCGGVARAIAGGTRGGCLVSIAVGFIGALLGSSLSSKLGLPEMLAIDVGGRSFPVIWSIIGGALFAAVITFLSGRKRV